MTLERRSGIVRTISGEYVDIVHPDPTTLHIYDIAWNLGRILRYNGATRQDYTVAHHSIIMSYYVPEEYALEALLHDAGEAYMGDIIWPVKKLFPAIEQTENELTAAIMAKFAPDVEIGKVNYVPRYEKSTPVSKADEVIFHHECFSFGDRPGIYSQEMQNAWTDAVDNAGGMWHSAQWPFMYRYHELIGTRMDQSQVDAALETLWFNYEKQDTAVEDLTEEQLMEIGRSAAEIEHP
jgi:hypothetical protein